MKAEELLTRSQEERDYGPPYFECKAIAASEPDNDMTWKLQTTSDVAKLFPWAKTLVTGCSQNFELKLVDDYEIVEIKRVA